MLRIFFLRPVCFFRRVPFLFRPKNDLRALNPALAGLNLSIAEKGQIKGIPFLSCHMPFFWSCRRPAPPTPNPQPPTPSPPPRPAQKKANFYLRNRKTSLPLHSQPRGKWEGWTGGCRENGK